MFMENIKKTSNHGFTLVELMVAVAISMIVIIAIGVVLVDSQRGWQVSYDRIYADVVTDSYVARKKFDAVMRKAGSTTVTLGSLGESIEVNYYNSISSAVYDRYGYFYVSDGTLCFEYGSLNPKVTIGTETVCANVSSCEFLHSGKSVQMILKLDDGTKSVEVVSSAVTHN
jgi:hypothetical protein